MDFLDQLEKTKDRVKHLLDEHPQTRNSDKLLWLAYMCIFSDLKEIMDDRTYKAFRNLLMDEKTPTFESLSRCRRKLQEDKSSFQATKEVKEKRYKNAEQVSNYFKNLRENT